MSEVQKTPFVKSLNDFVDVAMELGQQLLGRAIPAKVKSIDSTGTIVSVEFQLESIFTLPVVTCPVAFPKYLRLPLQEGDIGLCFSSDYYLGGISGLGGGVAHLTQQTNLSTLVFAPIGNADLDATDDPQKVVIYGPDGVILRDEDGRTVVTVKKTEGMMVDGALGQNVMGGNIPPAANDAEAKAKGVLINGFYHTNGVVKIRLT